ncbi:hypothetical protein DSO57_1015927 [Entomophthora muscae]|uniref:Uncharacterized protein n=1 Tax=Entomophthora muscae TaxID=34485 RepID=A0ACC2TSM2_9FUNG|nr:hypothetical protein DSO57_1015927 [Entomophthora muscae]
MKGKAVFNKADFTELNTVAYEFKHNIKEYLTKHVFFKSHPNSSHVTCIQDIIRAAKSSTPPRKVEFLDYAAQLTMTHSEYQQLATSLQKAVQRVVDDLLDTHRLDALAVSSQTRLRGTSLSALARYPIVNVPAGFNKSLPFGISLFSRPGQEPLLLSLANVIESQGPPIRHPLLPQVLKPVYISK